MPAHPHGPASWAIWKWRPQGALLWARACLWGERRTDGAASQLPSDPSPRLSSDPSCRLTSGLRLTADSDARLTAGRCLVGATRPLRRATSRCCPGAWSVWCSALTGPSPPACPSWEVTPRSGRAQWTSSGECSLPARGGCPAVGVVARSPGRQPRVLWAGKSWSQGLRVSWKRPAAHGPQLPAPLPRPPIPAAGPARPPGF